MDAATTRGALFLCANARMPSQRAQSLQLAQVAASYARAGVLTTLVHARRRDTPRVPPGELWEHYGVPAGARPAVEALGCVDWIDAVPRRLQFVPARAQELSFAWRAARRLRRARDARILTREVEVAAWLGSHPRLFVEVHRVPGGRLRRRWLARSAAAGARFLAISGGVRDDLVAGGIEARRVLVAHDGFEPQRFAELPARPAARAALALPEQGPLVVYTGGLLAWKGVDVLVDAARALPDVRFLIAGGMDADVARLRARAAGAANVRVDGFQPPTRVALYLAAADVGVVPNRAGPAISARYTSPLKVFEAMAAGLALVVSDLPSLRDVLRDDEALFVPPEDPGALARALRALLDDDELRAALGRRLGARAADHTWDARAARVLDWMDQS